MRPWLFLCVALAAVNDGLAGLGNDKQGPYEIMIRYFEDCTDGDADIKFYPKMKRVNRSTLTVGGYFVIKVPMDNNLLFSLQLDQKTSQGYKENFFFTDFHKKDICSTLEEYGDENNLNRLFGAIKNVETPYTKCPVESGKYDFEVAVLVEPFKKVPMFFYNTYRVIIRLYLDFDKPSIGCVSLLTDFVPKKKKG